MSSSTKDDKEGIKVLGVHGNYFQPEGVVHESSAALVDGGKLVAAISEDRLNREKGYGRYPYRSIDEVLRIGGIELEDLDKVVLSNLHPSDSNRRFLKSLISTCLDTGVLLSKKFKDFLWFWTYNAFKTGKLVSFEHAGKRLDVEVEYGHHHLNHAASAYYASPFDRAMVITLDGGGDGSDGGAFIGDGRTLERFIDIPHNQSPGTMYSALTYDLGFKRHRHEGKVTGLAAYGDPDPSKLGLHELIRYHSGKHRFISRAIARHQKDLNTPSPYFAPLLKSHSKEDLAAVVQELFERETLAFIRDAHQEAEKRGYAFDRVCLAGGCFANVRLNQKVHELPFVDNIFVFPAMGDEGLSAGAALLGYHRQEGVPEGVEVSTLGDAYLGGSFGKERIEKALREQGLTPESPDELESEVGRLLAEGKVIGRYNDRMEYGPRALGNRSILGAPFDSEVNDWLNEQLDRTEFMPFAPSILEEKAADYFEGYRSDHKAAELMTVTYDVKQEKQEEIPAVVHVDGTARPQVVKKEVNPSYHRIIEAFQEHSGCPVILNTSFNMHEEPIVYTPEDAVRAFLESRLDYLAIGDYLVPYPS
jgi:carbamoyltransferase